jgi:pSer/pThr/pTyr-binding forkhead associated (FHA) protein
VAGVICAKCGHENPGGANFCSSCGAPLRTPSEDTTGILRLELINELAEELQVDLGQFPVETGVLIVKRGPIAGSRFVLDQPCTTAGRHPKSDIFLDDITVSRRHAELLRRPDGRYVVRDVGSLNGTYVNRERVDEAELEDGDELQVGMFKLVFFHGTKPR